MFYAGLLYLVIFVILFINYKVWENSRQILKTSLFHNVFIEQNKKQLDIMEKQLKNSEEENIAGKMAIEQMMVMSDKIDLMRHESRIQMDFLSEESKAIREDLAFIKSILLEDNQLEQKNADFALVKKMNHEIIAVEESESEVDKN